ncbi:PREDICTED: uncharacterized protein LOC105555828 [Vollenhovia emeryi]|uniref:uncharacterized protein LOC105555828 n=1 Tax=Vollenhovia emeryi TaxID=411798 RepID=UPI0005F426E5|nr:PREDICTED: uncharacterized protein LOC105555828 [Vollenhovia emeryi]
MDKKLCKGCGTTVARPIICGTCGIASHPGCIARAGHPHLDGKFLGCGMAVSSDQDGLVSSIRETIRTEFRAEFAALREEILKIHHDYVEKVAAEMQTLSDRITVVERQITSSAPAANSEEVISEIAERERRSSNLIFYNLEESNLSSPTACASSDSEMAREIIGKIQPLDAPRIKTRRLGGFQQGRNRPLLVSFPSKADVLGILKMKNSYVGPVIIKQDMTLRQRDHLRELRKQLDSLRDSGTTDMTIKFFNGIPKIVRTRANSQPKNVSITL